MSEFCFTVGSYENCQGLETLALALAIECSFYIIAFAGGLRALEWWRNRSKRKR